MIDLWTPERRKAYQMARLNLSNFGIKMTEDVFKELLVTVFHGLFRAISSVDELLVRPRQAILYCDAIRKALDDQGELEAYDLPDDTILRTLLNVRKNP